MIRPATITRDDTNGVTYFVGEIVEGKYFGLFALYDSEAAQDISASLEYVGASVEDVFAVMKEAFRPKKAAKDGSATSDEKPADAAPAKRKRIAVQ